MKINLLNKILGSFLFLGLSIMTAQAMEEENKEKASREKAQHLKKALEYWNLMLFEVETNEFTPELRHRYLEVKKIAEIAYDNYSNDKIDRIVSYLDMREMKLPQDKQRELGLPMVGLFYNSYFSGF